MSAHDIIDNRNEKLADHINSIMASTERAKFAVGYFFVSGLQSIHQHLDKVKEIRLLIGNTTNRQTLEQISEGYRRLELVQRAAEEMRYARRGQVRRAVASTAENIRDAIELTDQTDDSEQLIKLLIRLIEEKRLKVKVYTKGRLHAKAYIFDYVKDGRYENGIAIVGSSNLTLAGVTHNTELNVVVQGNANHAELSRWFQALWEESQDFDEALMQELKTSWAAQPVRPYDIYMKTLYALVRDRLEEAEPSEILWDDEVTRKLADFQKVAVRQAIQMIRDYGGAFVSDVVGLGKSYVGSAIVKHFERTEHARALIICPKSLEDMWELYNERFQLNARVLPMSLLRTTTEEQAHLLLDDVRYRDRNLVLLDESHNFRHHTTQRYQVLQDFLGAGQRKSVFLTATPRNKSARDVYSQIKLFHGDDKTDLPIDPPDLKQYFRMIEQGERELQDLLAHILIRRTRHHILRWYGYDAETHEPVDPGRFRDYADGRRRAYIMVAGRHQFFPRRELETIEYSIEETYQGLYERIRGYLGRPRKRKRPARREGELTYARYGLWHYVVKDKKRRTPYGDLQRAGNNLRGLMRTMLFKRFESSVHAFRETVKRLLKIHRLFLDALESGIIPAGEEAQAMLYESDRYEESQFLDELEKVSKTYAAEDFEAGRLRQDIEHDVTVLQELFGLVADITPEKDAKLQTLLAWLSKKPLDEGKRLIFTQYADTAQYLYDTLNPGGERKDIDVIYSGNRSRARVVGLFAPKANPEFRFQKGDIELNTLVTTDVLAEGLNLQDCDKVVNYDLHWNPVRLIQRLGRIDRIGSENDVVWAFNFLPETALEKNLGLRQKVHARIQEIHDTIGEDSAILDRTEQLNEEAMYAIYEKKGGQLTLFEEEEDMVDLNEAEEMLRQLRSEQPEEYERIASLRDGIRSGKVSTAQGTFVFCQAERYQQLLLADEKGEVISRDIPTILGRLKSSPSEPAQPLPGHYNQSVMKIKKLFDAEVKQRAAEREHTLSLTHGQRYVLREMRAVFSQADDDLKAQINVLEKAFRASVTPAVRRELNSLRRNAIVGDDLFRHLSRIYHQHGLRELLDGAQVEVKQPAIPRIICSEALV